MQIGRNDGRASKPSWALRATVACLLAMALLAPQASARTKPAGSLPIVSTGGVSHVRGSSVTLNGNVNPAGSPATYYFLYGPTTAYGSKTSVGSLPAGTASVKVAETVTGFTAGEHYRLLATNASGTTMGRDRVFRVKSTHLKVALTAKDKEEPPVVYGSTLVLHGTVTGAGGVARTLALQSNPYPYKSAFKTIVSPITTTPSGSFTVRVPDITASTQFRVTTLEPRPIYSKVLTERVAANVKLKLRTTSHRGIVRLYGTFTPASTGAPVLVQLAEAARAGKSERTTRYATQFRTVSKRATKVSSRFSIIINVTRAGHYRVLVQLAKGPIVSGYSNTVTLSLNPTNKKAERKKKKQKQKTSA